MDKIKKNKWLPLTKGFQKPLVLIIGGVLYLACGLDSLISKDMPSEFLKAYLACNRDREFDFISLSVNHVIHILPSNYSEDEINKIADEDAKKTAKIMLPLAEQDKVRIGVYKELLTKNLNVLKNGRIQTSKYKIRRGKNGYSFEADEQALSQGITHEYYSDGTLYNYDPYRKSMQIETISPTDIPKKSSAYVIILEAINGSYVNKRFDLIKGKIEQIEADALSNKVSWFNWSEGDLSAHIELNTPESLYAKKIITQRKKWETTSIYDKWESVGEGMIAKSIHITQSKNGHPYAEASIDITDIELSKPNNDHSFKPYDFPLCLVQDNRFTPSLVYFAKTQLPSEEKIMEFASNPKLLEQHNALMQKLSR